MGERWVIPKAGSLAGLAKEAFDESSLVPGENCLLIHVHCIGLNFADIFAYARPTRDIQICDQNKVFKCIYY
jgi:hypothetical protein